MGGKPFKLDNEDDPVVENLAGARMGGRAARGADNDDLANPSRLGVFAGALAILAIGGSFILGTLGSETVLISS